MVDFNKSSYNNDAFDAAGKKIEAGLKNSVTATSKAAISTAPITTATTPTDTSNFWENMEGYDPNKELFADTSPLKIVQGSDDVRDQINGNKEGGAKTLNLINNQDAATTISDLRKTLGLRDPNAAFTSDEQMQISAAAEEASAEFLPLINAAEESQRMGMPKAVIGAGEKGGFESTQYAGAAALTPINSNDFVGAGGLLSEIKTGYERNIQELKVKRLQAMRLARVKAMEAIRTGSEQSNKDAIELFKLAQAADVQAVDKQQKLVNLTKSYREEDEAKITSLAGSLSSSLGDDNTANMKIITDAATKYQIDPNFLIGAINKELKDSMFFKSGDFISIMKELPAGTTRDITDPFTGRKYTIEGASSDAPDVLTVTDDKGTTRGINKATGVELWKTAAGVGKTNKGGGLSAPSGQDYYTILNALNQSKGQDGFVNTDVYKSYRLAAKDKTSFDKNFGSLLNPGDTTAQALIKEQPPETKWQEQKKVFSWLATPEAQSKSDEEKAQEIMGAGYDPKDFGIEL